MHTPGPWRLVDGKSEVIAGDCYHVAFVKAWFPEHTKQQEANARLIAAAPEMLDALKKTAETLKLEYPGSIYRANFKFIDGAIAQAEGK